MLKGTVFAAALTRNIRYSFIPSSCYEIQYKPNPVVKLSIGNDKGTFCDLKFRLFENVVPRTAENFKRLLLGTGKYQNRNLSLVGTGFSRHVIKSYLQLGELADGNCSIYGPKFRDESFQLFHQRPGLLTSISQQNTNSSRFAITVSPCPFMDLKNVVFGEVTQDTFNNIRDLQRLGNELFTLRILSSELVNTGETYHVPSDKQVFPDPDIADPYPSEPVYRTP